MLVRQSLYGPLQCCQVMALAGKVQAYALTSMTSKEESAQVMAALTALTAAAGHRQPARSTSCSRSSSRE